MKNAIITTIVKVAVLASIAAVCMSASESAWSAGYQKKIKDKDQTLLVSTNELGCAIDVSIVGEDNCQGSEFESNCGRNGKDCVCMRRNKFINWTIDNGARFQVDFIGPNPMQSSCVLKSGNNQRIKCKVEGNNGDYEYNVVVQGCPGEAYDPKIIIRN